ncbi:hypothetical protein J6Y73_03120 [bacterium]|nr:hypothetical protein [bacterium]
MPVSKKRKTEPKDKSNEVHYNVGQTKVGKIIVLILAAAMLLSLLIVAIFGIVNSL